MQRSFSIVHVNINISGPSFLQSQKKENAVIGNNIDELMSVCDKLNTDFTAAVSSVSQELLSTCSRQKLDEEETAVAGPSKSPGSNVGRLYLETEMKKKELLLKDQQQVIDSNLAMELVRIDQEAVDFGHSDEEFEAIGAEEHQNYEARMNSKIPMNTQIRNNLLRKICKVAEQHQDDADDLLDEDTADQKDEMENFDSKSDLSASESEELNSSPKKVPQNLKVRKPEALSRQKLSADPPSRTSVNSTRKSINSSDSEESENDNKPKKIPGEYDPKEFETLQVDSEIADVFQYIIKYTPQHMTAEYKFKPFTPEFIPAVGDIDAFLKVVPPAKTLSGEIFDENILQLGLLVLDEPASNQSDPALLHLQLRAATDNIMSGNEHKNIVVKKIDNIEKNSKVIDKWIKDISHLHKSKSSPIVRYSHPMPDLDDLMQQWPEEREQKLKEEGFPKPGDNESLSSYVDTVCDYFQIPIDKNKIQSLHLVFCLYTAIKQTQLYQAQTAANIEKRKQEAEERKSETDQLVLD